MFPILLTLFALNPDAAESVQHAVTVERPVTQIIHIRD